MQPETTEGDVNLSPARAAWTERLGPEIRALLDEDARWFLHQSLSTPCLDVLERTEGPWLIDTEGRRFLDFHGNSVHQLGHGHPRVVQAIKDTLDVLPFSPRRYTNRLAIDLARRLAEAAPGDLAKVLFAPSGTAAIGMALKLVRYATGRHKTVSMWDSFHGASLDAISVGGEALFRQGVGPLLPGTEHVPPPTRGRCRFGCTDAAHTNCTDYLDYVLAVQGDVAAVIAEPMRWTTVEPAPEGYWQRVRASCDRHGALLVFDEIPSCMGRTGTLFATEQTGCVPDILVVGKGLGGGVFPMAAMIARADLDRLGDRALGHYTHEKSSLGCAAALAALDVIEEESLCARARDLGARATAALEALRPRHPCIHEIRGQGLMLGVELRLPDGRPATALADRVLYAALERGLSFKVGGGCVLTLCPPLTIAESDLDAAIAILDESLAAATASPSA
ncbi:MAG: aspartate aminotransferase family protein [Geminicoccaceae bacterium]